MKILAACTLLLLSNCGLTQENPDSAASGELIFDYNHARSCKAGTDACGICEIVVQPEFVKNPTNKVTLKPGETHKFSVAAGDNEIAVSIPDELWDQCALENTPEQLYQTKYSIKEHGLDHYSAETTKSLTVNVAGGDSNGTIHIGTDDPSCKTKAKNLCYNNISSLLNHPLASSLDSTATSFCSKLGAYYGGNTGTTVSVCSLSEAAGNCLIYEASDGRMSYIANFTGTTWENQEQKALDHCLALGGFPVFRWIEDGSTPTREDDNESRRLIVAATHTGPGSDCGLEITFRPSDDSGNYTSRVGYDKSGPTNAVERNGNPILQQDLTATPSIQFTISADKTGDVTLDLAAIGKSDTCGLSDVTGGTNVSAQFLKSLGSCTFSELKSLDTMSIKISETGQAVTVNCGE